MLLLILAEVDNISINLPQKVQALSGHNNPDFDSGASSVVDLALLVELINSFVKFLPYYLDRVNHEEEDGPRFLVNGVSVLKFMVLRKGARAVFKGCHNHKYYYKNVANQSLLVSVILKDFFSRPWRSILSGQRR